MYGNDYGSGDASWMLDDGNDAAETSKALPETQTLEDQAMAPSTRAAPSVTGLQDNPFGDDSDAFSQSASGQVISESQETGALNTQAWGKAAGSFRYGSNNDNPDWMYSGSKQQSQSKKASQPHPPLEFGSDDYRESDVQFDGESSSTSSKTNELGQSLLSKKNGAKNSRLSVSSGRGVKTNLGSCVSSRILVQLLLF